MRTINNQRLVKGLLLAGGAGFMTIASPAMAQDNEVDCSVTPNAPTCEPSRIVVTGSRIQRQDFEANSPILTVDEGLLEQSSTAALEQNLNKLPQFTPAQTPTAGGDIQPTATNTPGAATISLRGIGSNRNLVLIDGRRATPSNATGVVDISTIPAAAIQRVEIITGGASSTYGADAIAGVTNFILKRNVQGLELDGRVGISQEGDQFEYQVSGIMGADFDDGRGNVSIAMSVNTREASYQRDTKAYQKLWADPNNSSGARFFPLYPGVALEAGNAPNASTFYNTTFPGTTAGCSASGQPLPNTINFACTVPIPALFNVYTNPDGSLFTTGRSQAGGIAGFKGITQQNDFVKRDAAGNLDFIDTNNFLILPLTRYNVFTRGEYEINDWISVFGQGLFSKVETFTTNQGGAFTAGWDTFFPYGTGVYTGSAIPGQDLGGVGNASSVVLNGMTYQGASYVDNTPGVLTDNPTNPAFTTAYANQFACANNAQGGCTNNQLFGQFLPGQIQTLLNSRTNPNQRVDLRYGVPEPRTTTTDVTTLSLIAGLQGKVPGTDWTWEAFVSHGQTDTYSIQTGVFSLLRLRTLISAPGFGQGFSASSNTASSRLNFGANFGKCTTGFNVFQLSWDQISQDCKDAIKADLKNRSSVRQTILEGNMQGGLFELPAGTLRFALGGTYRELDYKFINDTTTTQGTNFVDQAVGIYPSGDSFGNYDVTEGYGELLVPLLKDIPFIQELNLELGGRISRYSTTGTSYTYKILGDWSVTDWLRFRGGYNRAERAPNIAELYLSPQQTFALNNIGDICSQRSLYRISANSAVSSVAADVKAVCSAVMDNTGGAGTAASYYGRTLALQPGPGGGFSFPTYRGNPNLEPEVSDTYTAGVVISSPFKTPALSRLRLAVDYYNIKLNKAIGVSASAGLQQCFDPFFNQAVTGAAGSATQAQQAAKSLACSGITYDPAPILGLGAISASYSNAGTVEIAGLDAQFDWSFDVGPGTLSTNVVMNYYLHYRVAELASNPLVDYKGTFGTTSAGLNLGAYDYRILANLGYRIGGAGLSLQWQHLPSVEDTGEATAVGGTPTVGAPAYDVFALNGNFAITDDVNLRFGVENLLNAAPPLTNYNPANNPAVGQLPGGSYNSNFYDTQGRRFYLGANVKF